MKIIALLIAIGALAGIVQAQTNVTQASDGSITLSGTANNLIHLSSSNTNNTGIEFGNSASGLDYVIGVGGTTSGGLFPSEFAIFNPSSSTTALAVSPSGAMVPSGSAFAFSSSSTLPNSSNIDTEVTRFAAGQIAVLNPSNSFAVGTFVAAGFRMWNQSPPTCDSNARGTMVTVYGSGSADDHLEVCMQKSGSLSWQTVY